MNSQETNTSINSPKWYRDIQQLLPIRSQFLLSGNIRDNVALNIDGNFAVIPIETALANLLISAGYDALFRWDMVDGLQIVRSNKKEEENRLISELSFRGNGPWEVPIKDLGCVLRTIAAPKTGNFRVGLMIDFTSRLNDEGRYLDNVKKLFVEAEKAAQEAWASGSSSENAAPRPEENPLPTLRYNPIIWLLNREGDSPYWFSLDNKRVHSLTVPMPDAEVRSQVAGRLYSTVKNQDISQADFVEKVAALTHNFPISAIQDIVTLLNNSGKPGSDVDDAVQCYRIGDLSMDNPWRAETLRQNIRNGETLLGERVKGQEKATIKVLDALKRTSIGLTGAHVNSNANRPRGVLFFAGPTGTGKTEMAKAITKLVFGNESAYKRFDMSEFSAEHSADRLIGAPPGYVGFNQGGELTNAMRENPFRVLLFDEIEKANPRILDKFLQILEDGRLTDGRGDTVYFTDALIIFTSNAGISRKGKDGEVEFLVSSKDSQEDFEKKMVEGVKQYFREELRRPELLNRIGENIVIFNFIRLEIGVEILNTMLGNISDRLLEEHGISFRLDDSARKTLTDVCISDLGNGGRGIGAKLEDAFTNPLARFMFESFPAEGQTIYVHEISNQKSIYTLRCENLD